MLHYFVGGVGVDFQAGGEGSDAWERLAGEVFAADERSFGGVDHLIEDGLARVERESERCHSCTVTRVGARVKKNISRKDAKIAKEKNVVAGRGGPIIGGMRIPHRGLLCSLLILCGLAVPGSLFSAVTIMDEIVCKVNGDIITRSQLEKARKDLIERGKQGGFTGAKLDEAVNQYMADVLRDKIDTMLLVQKGKEMDLKVETELNKLMADFQRQSGVTDPDKFQALVREQAGEPYEDFRNDRKNEILKNRVIQEEITRKIQFKRPELEAYYNDHKKDFERQERVFLSMILVSGAGKDAAAIEKKAKDLATRAKTEKFADLAVQSSDDPNTAPQGGAMDPQEKGGLRTEIEDAVWDKPKGFVTDPIKLGTNFAIFKVDDHPKAGLAEFEEVQYEVQNIMLQARATPAVRAYLTKLRENAFLEIKPGFEDSGAAPGKDTTWIDPAQLKPETTTKEEVLAKTHKKKLLKVIPVPGTTATKTGTSSSK